MTTDQGVSIVTPLYNQTDIFWETYNSVVTQNFSDWEWIIVNDGSDEIETKEILDKILKAGDRRIRVHHHSENRGLPAARNAGAKLAKYNYIFFIDSDDLIENCYLEKALLTLELNRAFSFVNSWSTGFGDKNYQWQFGFEMKEKFLEKNYVAFCGLFRKQCVLDYPFNEEQKEGLEDWEFWINLAAHGHWGYTIPEYLFHYRTSSKTGIKWKNWDEGKNEALFKKHLDKKYKKCIKSKLLDISFDRTFHEVSITANAFPKQKPMIAVVLPWLQLGGVEQFTLGWMRSMIDLYDFVVVTTQSSDHPLTDVFKECSTAVFHLSNLCSPVQYLSVIKYIFSTRQPELLVLSHSEIFYSCLQWLRGTFPYLNIIDINHVVEPHYNKGGFPKISSKHTHLLDKHVVVSKNLQQWMCKEGVEESKTQVVYLGANIEESEFLNCFSMDNCLANTNKSSDKFLIAFSGRLVEQKNIPLLIQIAKKLKKRNRKFKLIICGDGPEKSYLEDAIYQNRLTCYITFVGNLSHSDGLKIIKAADALILPSKWEGIATVLYEAMSLGTPIIATNVGGQEELVDQESGILLPLLDDPKEMADLFVEKIESLMGEPSVSKALGINAQLRVKNLFNKADSHHELQKLFGKHITSKTNNNTYCTKKGVESFQQYVFSKPLDVYTPIHLKPTPSLARLRLKKVYKIMTLKRPVLSLWSKK
ncbi:glycosyltransferase [Pontibacter cellulosilyticus]|uniref:Glycosyltransferase n=1 Tax=Pontibacter cellulosilyticus TaxID=1720253 RepID=A0A923N4Z2_9BACT|nr:glycosyltransferase [Pontibacter cellulosilyticus]MBC5992313.1 glycosyltransferase [Pontibacter cellulosilyticus]